MAGFTFDSLDGDGFYESLARDESAKLRALLRAIPKWEQVARAELEAVERTNDSLAAEEYRQIHARQSNDGFSLLQQTNRALFAGRLRHNG